MFTKNLRFFGQILHPQWPTQTSKMGLKTALVLQGLRIHEKKSNPKKLKNKKFFGMPKLPEVQRILFLEQNS
jgi:hypothetical protein